MAPWNTNIVIAVFVSLTWSLVTGSSSCFWLTGVGPAPRAYAAVVTVADSTFVIGGYDSTISSYVPNVDRYNSSLSATANTSTPIIWSRTEMSPMPSLRQGFACSATTGVGAGFIYCAGGFRSERRVDEADSMVMVYLITENKWVGLPEGDNTWMALATVQFFIGAGMTAIGFDQGSVYIMGGTRRSMVNNTRGYRASAIVTRWDITTATWTTEAELPSPRYSHSSVQTGGNMGYVWIIGGALHGRVDWL